MVGGLEVLAGVVVFSDLPGGVEAAEGAGGDGEVELLGGDAGGVFGAVLFVEVDALLFLFGGEAGEDGVDFAGAGLGLGNFGFEIRNFRLGIGVTRRRGGRGGGFVGFTIDD